VGQISGQVARLGLDWLLTFVAFFSINLAILNLLPIPILDGGQLVFLIAEALRGKPLSRSCGPGSRTSGSSCWSS